MTARENCAAIEHKGLIYRLAPLRHAPLPKPPPQTPSPAL